MREERKKKDIGNVRKNLGEKRRMREERQKKDRECMEKLRRKEENERRDMQETCLFVEFAIKIISLILK